MFETPTTNPGHSLFATVVPLRSTRCRDISRGCVEVGQDHGGLEQRNLKSEEGGFLATRSSEWERLGESRAEADTGGDAGSKYVRERECFCQTTDARCNREKLASERESKRHTRAYKHGRRHREARKRVERNTITITARGGARGYSRIRAGGRAQSSTMNKVQGDG